MPFRTFSLFHARWMGVLLSHQHKVDLCALSYDPGRVHCKSAKAYFQVIRKKQNKTQYFLEEKNKNVIMVVLCDKFYVSER